VVWEISAEYPEARLTVGADPGAGWAIHAAGVQPVHCELFWDGNALWVADTHAAGGVFLDGQRVSDWMQIHGPAELRFGAASMDIETSPPAHEQMASRPDQARPATVTDMHAPPERRIRPIFGGAASDDSIPELDAAATRVVASPALPVAPPAAAPPSGGGGLSDLRPRLGGNVVAGSAEATRMVPMPVARPGAPARPPGPPAPPGQGPAAVVAPPPAPPSLGASAPVAPPMPPPPDPGYAPVPPPDGGAAFAPPPVVPVPATKPSPFAQILQKLKPQSSAEVVSASGGKKGQALPTRTWIMLAVTVAAAAGLLLWPEDEPEPAPAAAAAVVAPTVRAPSAPPAPTPAPTAPTAPAPTPPTATEATATEATPTEATPTVTPPGTVEGAPSSAQASTSQTPTAEGEVVVASLQRQAADHYIAGRLNEALAIYRQLAEADPTSPAYASMVRILERRTRCRDGVGPGGAPCVEP
jgi:ribonuclease E